MGFTKVQHALSHSGQLLWTSADPTNSPLSSGGRLIAAMVRLIRPDVIDTGTSNRQSLSSPMANFANFLHDDGVNGVFSGILTSKLSTSCNLFGCKNSRQSPPAPFCSRSQAVTGPKCETAYYMATVGYLKQRMAAAVVPLALTGAIIMDKCCG